MAELCKCWKLKICYDQDYNDIGVVIATKGRHNVLYLQLYFSALAIFRPKSFTGAFSSTFSSNNCYDRCPLSLSKICERNFIALEESSVFEWDWPSASAIEWNVLYSLKF